MPLPPSTSPSTSPSTAFTAFAPSAPPPTPSTAAAPSAPPPTASLRRAGFHAAGRGWTRSGLESGRAGRVGRAKGAFTQLACPKKSKTNMRYKLNTTMRCCTTKRHTIGCRVEQTSQRNVPIWTVRSIDFFRLSSAWLGATGGSPARLTSPACRKNSLGDGFGDVYVQPLLGDEEGPSDSDFSFVG